MQPDLLIDLELSALRRLSSLARREAARETWRAAMQVRTSRIAGLLRAMPRLLQARDVGRIKVEGRWMITGTDLVGERHVVVEVTTRCAGRSLLDLSAPLVTRVHRQDLVHMTRIEDVEQSGLVVLERGTR